MIDAFKRASAGRITAVIPYYGYARQDRKAKSRDPISAKLVADLITAAGTDRVLTMDLHAAQIQGFFDIPVDHLQGVPLLAPYFVEKFKDFSREDLVVVSPDLGSVTRARKFADRLGAPIAIIDKRRPRPNVSEVMNIIGDVQGKTCIIVDDIIDTAGTICNAASCSGRARRCQGSIRLCHPWRTVRPGNRAHREQRLQGDGSAGYHSGTRQLLQEDRSAAGSSPLCRCH